MILVKYRLRKENIRDKPWWILTFKWLEKKEGFVKTKMKQKVGEKTVQSNMIRKEITLMRKDGNMRVREIKELNVVYHIKELEIY